MIVITRQDNIIVCWYIFVLRRYNETINETENKEQMPKYVVGVRFNKSAIQNKTKTKVKSLRIKEEHKQPKPNKELVEGSIVKNIVHIILSIALNRFLLLIEI